MMNKMVEATELGPDIEWMFGLDNEKVLCECWLASAVALKDPIGWQVGYRRRQEGLGADRGRQGAHQGLRGRVDEGPQAPPVLRDIDWFSEMASAVYPGCMRTVKF